MPRVNCARGIFMLKIPFPAEARLFIEAGFRGGMPRGINAPRLFCVEKRIWIEEVKVMTLNIFFMTITIKARQMDPEEIMERERVRKITEENKNRQFSMYRPF